MKAKQDLAVLRNPKDTVFKSSEQTVQYPMRVSKMLVRPL